MITKQELSSALNISCVENYFLAWLEKYFDITKLYGIEFLSLFDVLKDFSKGVKYQEYCGIRRLQDVAEELGVTKHQYFECGSLEALQLIKDNKDSLCLVRVNSSFFDKFKRKPWRDDHFICVNEYLEWVNQYPLSEGKLSYEEFDLYYDGVLCIYNLDNINKEIPNKITDIILTKNSFELFIPSDFETFESAISIFLITRRRLYEYYKDIEQLKYIIGEEIAYLNYLSYIYYSKVFKKIEIDDPGKIKMESDIKRIVDYEDRIIEVLRNVKK